jgi:hypothetical protein
MSRSKYQKLRRAGENFLAEAFTCLEKERVLPRSRYEPWIHMGTHYEGHLLASLPACARLESEIEAAFPQIFAVRNGHPSDFASIYPATLVDAVVARLTKAGEPYDHSMPQARQSIEELIILIGAKQQSAICIRIAADIVAPPGFKSGPLEVISVSNNHSGPPVQTMIERLIPEAGYEADKMRMEMMGRDRVLLVARSTERRDTGNRIDDPFTVAADRMDRQIDEFLTAVRLVTNSTAPNLLSVRGIAGWVRRYPPEVSVVPSMPFRFVRRSAVFNADDGPRLHRIANRLSSAARPAPLSIAIGRFNRSYIAAPWWERLLDLAIALEAVFGEAGEREDTTLRMRTRVASLLATPTDTADRLFADVGHCYDLRSIVVHGITKQPNEIKKIVEKVPATATGTGAAADKTELLVDRFRDIVRRAILVRLVLSGASAPIWPFNGRNEMDRWLSDDRERAHLRREWRQRVRALGFPRAADAAPPATVS